MRTTIDIDEKLIREAWNLIRPRSKRELIEVSLQELIRQEHRQRLVGRLGKTPMITVKELLRQRRRG